MRTRLGIIYILLISVSKHYCFVQSYDQNENDYNEEDCDEEPEQFNQFPSLQNFNNNPMPTFPPENCEVETGTSVNEEPQEPEIKVLSTKTDISTEVTESEMEATELTEVIYMKPMTSVKMETYTVSYGGKSKTLTRKRIWIKRRRKIRRKKNKPKLRITRKYINHRQTIEKIFPKIVETREIVNKKPELKERIESDPPEEVFDGGSYDPNVEGYGANPGYDGDSAQGFSDFESPGPQSQQQYRGMQSSGAGQQQQQQKPQYRGMQSSGAGQQQQQQKQQYKGKQSSGAGHQQQQQKYKSKQSPKGK